MKRGVLVAVVLSGIAWSAGAEEPARVRLSSPRTVPVTNAAPARDFREKGPDTFDLAVSAREGRGLTIYRYNRATRTAVLVTRLPDREVESKTTGFIRVGEGKIVLSPEGYKKPIPPQPPGGGELTWALPEAELQAALQAVQKIEPGAKVVSIGQIAVPSP